MGDAPSGVKSGSVTAASDPHSDGPAEKPVVLLVVHDEMWVPIQPSRRLQSVIRVSGLSEESCDGLGIWCQLRLSWSYIIVILILTCPIIGLVP